MNTIHRIGVCTALTGLLTLSGCCYDRGREHGGNGPDHDAPGGQPAH